MHFVGISLGGIVAQQLAADYPALVRSVVLANTCSRYDDTAQGIWQALITTAYGLTVAIPTLLLYRFLQGRTGRIVGEMEEDAMGIVNLLEDSRRGRAERVERADRADRDRAAPEPAR